MSSFDCPKCWAIPCTCGHMYRDYKLKDKLRLISAVLGTNIKAVREMLAGRCPYCLQRQGEMSHGKCRHCKRTCGCSFNPVSNSDFCRFHE